MEKTRSINGRRTQPAATFESHLACGGKTEQMLNQTPGMTAFETNQIVSKSMDAMILAYLSVNLDYKHISLKDFIAALEKKLLLTSLRLTRGNQKNAATILGIKPTVMFEKMRKYEISRQQVQISQVQMSDELKKSLLELTKQGLTELKSNSAFAYKPYPEQISRQNSNKNPVIIPQAG